MKPNFTPAAATLPTLRLPRVVFVGEIARPEGANLLLDAWARLPQQGIDSRWLETARNARNSSGDTRRI